MSGEAEKVEPAESEQDEEEDVYEVERIIDMRVEEGEVLYRVRWKNYCSDDDTWEPEAHLEDCREVLLSFKKALAEAKAKKEADAKKTLKFLPTKSDVFDADSESDSDKERPADAPLKKKKKKKPQEEEPLVKEKKKKKKDKRREDFRPLPAPETDEENDVAEEAAASPLPPKEKKTELKKRVVDSDEEEDEHVPSKKVRKDKGKEGGRPKKEKGEEGKKKKGKKDRKVETSEDEAVAPLEDDLSDGPSQTDGAAPASAAERISSLEDKFKLKKGRLEVRLQGIKDIIADKKSKKPDASAKDPAKLKSLASKNKDDAAPHSDSSDSSTLHRKSKSKGPEGASTTPKAPSSSTSSSSSSSLVAAGSTKGKDDEVAKEEVLGPKDAAGSVNLFEKFLLNCEAKDRAPRRPPPHQGLPEKSCTKSNKLIGKIEKIQKSNKDSPPQKPEMKKMDKNKQSDAARPGQSHGFSLDSDEIEGEDLRERKERPEEAQRASWDRRTPTDDKRRRREDSEPRLFMACDDNQDAQDPSEATDKCDKGQATLSLGMDLNLDWMTLDDFQKHLNGEDEILSGPPLSPSELRDAVKSGDYMSVKLALNSKEEYNLDQEACTIGEMKSFEAEGSLSEERSSSDALRLSPNFDSTQNEEGTSTIANITPQILDFERDKYPPPSDKIVMEQVTTMECENVQKCGKDVCNPKDAAPAIMQRVEENEDQVQPEGDKMSHDKAGGSSSEISWIFDHLNPTTSTDGMATDKDRTVTNGGALKQPSCEEERNAHKSALKRKPWSEKEQSAVKRYLCEFITKMKVPGKKECNACIAAEPDLNGRSWTDIKNYVHNTLQTMRRRTSQQKAGGNASQNPRPRVRTKKKDSTEATNLCNMTTVHPDHLTESSDCCMTMAAPAALRESSEPFHQELNSSYASLCSTSENIAHTSQPLISTFTALNATDTQVVPTFTPHNTTNALMPSVYSSENSMMMPMSPPYTQHATSLPAPSSFAPHDTTSSSVYSNFSTFNAPSTSMVHTFTPLNTPSSSMVPPFSTLNTRDIPIVSSFTPLNHPSTPAYDTPTATPTTAQVVPTIHRPSVPDRTQVEQNTPISPEATPPAAKPQKRIKRLWSEEEQAAVRRQFGDFSKLMKVPGKKDCDACLVAEPALNSRTWREVKYFVHNSIQSMKRKGQQVPPKHVGEDEPETHNQNPEWDGPVYLSL
ncbi:M-phase phosphoprotein 8 isoform X2 [Nelusetta ayraudi]|uniref:M-phase phosphoprotein 8 isoform X2 n=1 Tax=Nelusetta ayraudi TaxID=303726 RepID=UPI003F727DD9